MSQGSTKTLAPNGNIITGTGTLSNLNAAANNYALTTSVPSTWSSIYTPSYMGYTSNTGIYITKAENGWILTKDGKTYVFVNIEDMVPLIKSEK